MPRTATPLTDSAIKAAKPKEKPYKLTDGQVNNSSSPARTRNSLL